MAGPGDESVSGSEFDDTRDPSTRFTDEECAAAREANTSKLLEKAFMNKYNG